MEKEPQFETMREYGHDFLELTSEKSQELKARIEKWHGLVRMFVHPMYEKWRGHEEQYRNDSKFAKLIQIEQVLAKLLAMPEEKTPPIIIMEEKDYVVKLQQWLKENPVGSSQGGVYFVRTLPKFPTPWLKGREYNDYAGAWEKLIETLDDCGVKKILMGGMRLKVSSYKGKDWTGKDPFIESCVGIAMSHLSKDKAGKFEVELSALTDSSSERERFNRFKQKS